MKLGVSIPNNWGVEDASKMIDLAVLAEELGFASVWTSEHLVNNAYVRARIGDRPYYHPLAVLSAIAGRTSRIALGTSVIVLPFHHPLRHRQICGDARSDLEGAGYPRCWRRQRG
jgi:alkanesulfonate monooxygenase SsuD/methylene tetrahydromethanopterin reductase-like flavin-dependent oxidoreductase (luciferase family)